MGNMEVCEEIIQNIQKERPEKFISYSQAAIRASNFVKNWKIVQLISKHCEEFSKNN